MTMNPLPPQAYTKETLLKAYQWLITQNSSIKEIATTPDMLVSLYLKATRDGESALDRPSIKNFKNELKSLAGMMGELDRPQAQSHHHSSIGLGATAAAMPVSTAQTQAMVEPTPEVHRQQVAVQMPMATTPSHHQTQTLSYTEKTLMATSQPLNAMDLFDGNTKAMIHEVKDEFNLSSELEALRMLIKIGYVKSKGMLK
ncbi:MAG: hypothetical protein ACM3MG_14110 [Bacillota bacterium]